MPQPDAEAAYARGDYATAFKIWLPLAEQGSARRSSQCRPHGYERGEWVAQDKRAAMEWCNKAAAQNGPRRHDAQRAQRGERRPLEAMPPSSATYPQPIYYPSAVSRRPSGLCAGLPLRHRHH